MNQLFLKSLGYVISDGWWILQPMCNYNTSPVGCTQVCSRHTCLQKSAVGGQSNLILVCFDQQQHPSWRKKYAHLQVAPLTSERWSNLCGFLCKSCWGLWNDCGGSVRMALSRALQALQLELQNGSDLISLGKTMAISLVWICGIFTQRWPFVRVLVPSNLPHLLCLSPYFALPWSLGEVRRPDLKPTFLLHEMLMSSRWKIKMPWLTFWHMMTGLWRSANLRPAEVSPGKVQTLWELDHRSRGFWGTHTWLLIWGMRRLGSACVQLIAGNVLACNSLNCCICFGGEKLWNHPKCEHSSVNLRVTLSPPLV